MTIFSLKKIFKGVIVVSFVFAITIFLCLTVIIKYHIKSVLREVVRRETNGAYQLDFANISINFTKGSVLVNDANLKRAGISQSQTDYQLKITGLYFSLTSWNELLFHRTLFVDSLRINRGNISVFHSPSHTDINTALQLQEIYNSLKSISEKFKVRVLEIRNTDISIYNSEANSSRLLISNINFRVENFGQKQNETTKLRYSDDIVLSIPRQLLTFPSGHSFSFKNLFFSGRDQFFEVDSCTISFAPGSHTQTSSLFADKLLFRADDLSSIFEKNELSIDTLYCKSPTLSFKLPYDELAKDSVGGLNQLLGNIHIRYVNVENGQIQLNSSDGKRSYASQKTNLKIYAMEVSHDKLPYIRAGDIDFHLNEVSFVSRDSLYLLTIKDFELDGNDLVCRNAFLKPSSKNSGSLSSINLPAFTLVDVSLQDLLEKRLKAQSIVIERPQINFIVREKKKKIIELNPVYRFYDVLNELAQIIDVHKLIVNNGELKYNSVSTKDFKLCIKDITFDINLDDLVNSSSLLATKRSIQSMSIDSFNLNTGNANVEVKKFFINGSKQTGKIMSLSLNLSSGVRMNGMNIYWQKFSWEDFIKLKRIDLDSLDIGQLYLSLGSGNHGVKNIGVTPRVTVKKTNIREALVDVRKRKNNTEISAKAQSVLIRELNVTDSLFYWSGLTTKLESIYFRDDDKKVSIQQLQVSDSSESLAKNIVYHDSTNLVKIPQIKFQLNVHSSNFKSVFFPYLAIYQPEIWINKTSLDSSSSGKNTVAGIIPFHVQKLDLIDGYFNYKFPAKQIYASANFVMKLECVKKHNYNEAILFDKASFNFDSVSIETKKFPVTLDELNLGISMGSVSGMNQQKLMLTGFLNAQWKSLTLKKQRENNFFEISDLSGMAENFPLALGLHSTNIRDITDKISLTKGRLFYSDSAITATISNISGIGKEGALEFKDVEIKPKVTLKSFIKTSQWQKDYLTFNCDKIVLKKINSEALFGNNVLAIQHIFLQNPRLSTYRDKNIVFQHGIEKLMPTKLITRIKIPLQVDSVSIKGATIDVHEVSLITKREGVVPLRNIEALFENLTNQPKQTDSLRIHLVGRALDYDINKFMYTESYNDSLSGFKMSYRVSSMSLPALTKVTGPLSAVAVTSGYADTLYTMVSGNNYASFGLMNFHYNNLRIRFLNKKDTLKKNFLLALETMVANDFVIKPSNKKQTFMFFIRDRERFVFNYWVKTLLSGFLTSTGVKRNGKYKKMHDQLKDKYSLPVTNN